MEMIGEYYTDKVLSQGRENLKKKELIGYSCFGETKMEQDLFGWKIHTKRRIFEFDSEVEARYTIIFLELGWRSVYIPKDLNYLAEILSRLEYLKMRADEVIGNGVKRIFGRKIRWEARVLTYQKISVLPENAPKFDDTEFEDFDYESENYEEDFDDEDEPEKVYA
jgi:hypothetical protein